MPFSSAFGWVWIVAPIGIALVGTIVFLRGMGHAARGQPGRGTARMAVGGPLAGLGFVVGLLALNTQSFVRLTYEAPVAEVRIAATAPQLHFAVTVERLDGVDMTTRCDLVGDEWQLSAHVQKWKPWANVLGLDTTYTLDQVANKYRDGVRGNGELITACDLVGPPPAINQFLPRAWLDWLTSRSYTEDRRFGSAVYMPLADGAVYRVIITQSGLNAEPENDIARAAVASQL